MENKKLDMDSFGEIMDKVILDNDISLLINMPAGTIEPEIQDNTGAGPVMQFYILLNALSRIVTERWIWWGSRRTPVKIWSTVFLAW